MNPSDEAALRAELEAVEADIARLRAHAIPRGTPLGALPDSGDITPMRPTATPGDYQRLEEQKTRRDALRVQLGEEPVW
jgi:hypothetical protein